MSYVPLEAHSDSAVLHVEHSVGLFRWRSVSRQRVQQIVCGVIDQGAAVGGMFLANIALARTRSKEEYGLFALLYSVYTFLSGLHNAAILEAYTIYGSGRYSRQFSRYARLLWRSNALLGTLLTALLLVVWSVLAWAEPPLASRTFLGLSLTSGILLTASFVRRTFYMRRRPDLAARYSGTFLLICAALLGITIHARVLTGFSAFLVVALSWSLAAVVVIRELPGIGATGSFIREEPGYWIEHWSYSRWVLVTALVFQCTTQGYYWLVAGFLSIKQVAELRATYNLVTPVDQCLNAMALLILPILSFRYASKGKAGLVPLWKAYLFTCLAITIGFAGMVWAFGQAGMHYLYAGKFDDIAALVSLYALVPITMAVGNTINAALKAMEQPRAVFFGYLASGVATFSIGIPLVMHFGLRGAVIGMLFSAGIYTAALAMAFLRLLRPGASYGAGIG